MMIYLSSFKLSNREVGNSNIYPYNVFRGRYIEPFVFSPITVFYGNNGSGKSTLLNIIANKLQLKGKEHATSNSYGMVNYCNSFSDECAYSLGKQAGILGYSIAVDESVQCAYRHKTFFNNEIVISDSKNKHIFEKTLAYLTSECILFV